MKNGSNQELTELATSKIRKSKRAPDLKKLMVVDKMFIHIVKVSFHDFKAKKEVLPSAF